VTLLYLPNSAPNGGRVMLAVVTLLPRLVGMAMA
jgi:hypothetical protein